MVFLKEFFEKVDFETNQQAAKKHEKNYPACIELKEEFQLLGGFREGLLKGS